MGKKSKNKKGRKIESLDEGEKRQLYSRAAKLRKASRNRTSPEDSWKKHVRDGNYEHVVSSERRTGKGPESLDEWAQKALSKADQMKIWDKTEHTDKLHDGVITAISRQGGILLHKGVEYDFMIKPEMLLLQKTEITVGEKILFSFDNENHCMLEQTKPRTQILSRPDPTRKNVERTIAVNMDAIIIVASIDSPKLNFSLIDRFLIGVEQSAAKAILCINKCDLKNEENSAELYKLDVYRSLGVDIFFCSAEEGEGLEELFADLAGKTCVFLGTSGVGKSSLLNALDPELQLRTAETRERAAGRGRHTTVMSQMYLVRNDIKVIDTPGVREFNFLDLEAHEVQYGFKEFREFLPCQFNNCTHEHEKKCAIKDAVERGDISKWRYDSYLKILKTLSVKRLAPKQRDNLLF
ncbi:MAG: ribosome small subunit-dependent GTPase A [Lentisphaeraceae bacterium]|nr:ribosome small subunit-dependent GTPase A [Lentisphaeraceae bacterium]